MKIKMWDHKVKKVSKFMNSWNLIHQMYKLKELMILKPVEEAIKAIKIFKRSKI